jgi:DUF1680 family protein
MTVAGEPVAVSPADDGYVRVRRAWRPGTEVRLTLPMPPRVLVAHPRVDAVRGCVALARGPLVYCVEQADHPEDVPVEDLRVDPASPPLPDGGDPGLGVPVTLTGAAVVRTALPEALYAPGGEAMAAPTREVTLTAIPYFRWANRGPNAMRVWIPTA